MYISPPKKCAVTLGLLVCVAALTMPGRAHALYFSPEETALLVGGGFVALAAEVLAVTADVKVSIDLSRGRGVSRGWSVLGVVLWTLNLGGAIATAWYSSNSNHPIGLEISVAWLGLSAASLALNIVGVSQRPLLVPTLVPGPGGSLTAGVAMSGHW